MRKPPTTPTTRELDALIYEVRGHKVMLDSELAEIYSVPTKRLLEQVRRNVDRFPRDFAFQITREEYQALRSQIATLKTGRGQHRKYLPFVFTEHGAIMAANVLNSPRAVQMSVFVVRAFLKMRSLLGDKQELAKRLAALEKELKQRLDVHEAAIVTILQRVMDIIDPPALPPAPSKPRIGFRP
jgi:phage regulator Rha-like protein